MNETVVNLPVSAEAALLLQDQERARAVGRLVGDLLHPNTPQSDPLAAMIASLKAEARAGGLTDDVIDAELAAYNAENRL